MYTCHDFAETFLLWIQPLYPINPGHKIGLGLEIGPGIMIFFFYWSCFFCCPSHPVLISCSMLIYFACKILYSVSYLHNILTDQTLLTATLTLSGIVAIVSLWLWAFKLHYLTIVLASSHTPCYQQAKLFTGCPTLNPSLQSRYVTELLK